MQDHASKDGNDTNTVIIIRLPTKEQAKLSLARWTETETTPPASKVIYVLKMHPLSA
jgi:hypothetical protein